MKNDHLYTSDSPVYPGEYIPLYKEDDSDRLVKRSFNNKAGILSININESETFYKVELTIPGAKRENIFLRSCGNILSVSVIHDEEQPDKEKKQFAFGSYLSQKIILPGNADTLFISAEYISGILNLYIPKSEHPLKGVDTKIAVY